MSTQESPLTVPEGIIDQDQLLSSVAQDSQVAGMPQIHEVFDANTRWGEKPGEITPLQNPISEFNARGGMELSKYREMKSHFTDEYPELGKEMWAKTKEKLPAFEMMQDPRTGQNLRVQRFNWPDDGDVAEQTVTIVNRGFYVSIDPDHIQYQHYSIAEELDSPLIVFENPEYGESDGLTHEQKKALKDNGDFGPVAEPMLGIAKALGIKKVNLVGYSMAAAIADAIAAHAIDYDIEVEALLDMEDPMVVEEGGLKLAHDFSSDGRNLKFAWKNPMDPVLQETAKLEYSIPKGILSYGRALKKGGEKTVLAEALDSQPKMRLILASAGASKISPAAPNRQLYDELHTEYAHRTIRRIIMPGESHAYSNSAQRFADLVKRALAT
ncbi:MAG: hypothetical protein WDN66_01155 [Candidatus Saccharibacteria bacterium]